MELVNKTQSLPQWLEVTAHQAPYLDWPLIQKAGEFITSHQEKIQTPYVETTIQQGIFIAEKLVELNCDTSTIAAALLYPTIHYGELATTELIPHFDETVIKLIEGTKRLNLLQLLDTKKENFTINAQQIDNLRKMLLAIVDDIRIVLIKLAERLSVLNGLKNCPREMQLHVAQQTMHIFAPLANRLGIGQIKWLMEDLSFRYLEPEIYKKISKELKMRRAEREDFINDMLTRLKKLMQGSYVSNFSIAGRAKHIYSIYRKMQRKRIDFNQVYDTSAFRIIVSSIHDCYTVLGIIHASWPHVPKEFDDYIAKPKANGYQSIHTVIIGPHNIHVEIQIRTRKMHEDAELGIAAHWKYKEGASQQDTYEQKINLLREVMNWQKEITDETMNPVALNSVFQDRIYVFTPNSDIFDLPSGATPLDFAYHLHTDIGHRCRGAKINNKLEPLTHTLKTGDRVQILTGKIAQPSRDWLNTHLGYVTTTQARNKIRHWFRKLEQQDNTLLGQALWEKNFRRNHLAKDKLLLVTQHFNFKTNDELFAAIGAGDIGIQSIAHFLKIDSHEEKTPEILSEKKALSETAKKTGHLVIEGVNNLLTQLARCCKPIPGDDIIGYITKGRGITIHQRKCNNITNTLQTYPERLIDIHWGSEKPKSFSIDLTLQAHDNVGIIRDVSNVIASENIMLTQLNSHVKKQENKAYIYLSLEVKNLESLKHLINMLQKLPNIISVTRN